jgi:hypothetical protein
MKGQSIPVSIVPGKNADRADSAVDVEEADRPSTCVGACRGMDGMSLPRSGARPVFCARIKSVFAELERQNAGVVFSTDFDH